MTVEIRGDRELLRRLKKLNKRELSGALEAMGQTVATKATIYPPAKPTYARTFNLFDSWKVKPKKSDFAVEASNTADYAPYVHDDKRQASFHRNAGWKRLAETAKNEADEIIKILKRQVDAILEGRK